MSRDLGGLLRASVRWLAGRDDDARGSWGRVAMIVTGIVAALVLVGGMALVAIGLTGGAPATTATGERSEPAPPTSDGGELPTTVVTATDLDADVFLSVAGDDRDGQVLRLSPDGRERRLPVEVRFPSRVAMVVDDQGGFAYQPSGGSGGSPPIIEVGVTGASQTLVAPTTDPSETYTLVGASGGGFVVAHRVGDTPESATVDLLRVGHGGERSPLREAVAGPVEGGSPASAERVVAAASLDLSLYAIAAGKASSVVVDPPDGPATTVWRGAASAVDVAVGGDAEAFVLVQTDSGSEVLRFGLREESPAVIAEPVPVDLAAPGRDVVATELSVHQGQVLVNRLAHGGEGWLEPLIWTPEERTRAPWSLFERPGRALLGRPVPADRVRAPPSDGS